MHEPYHDYPVAVSKRGENTWFELSIFFKRFELLITGGIVASQKLTPFLGPNIPLENMTSHKTKTSKDIFVSSSKIAFVTRERTLRN
ncbi:hypothetical protein EDC94DRAFT_612188 [Helicostylum pulchrum]|nr:hypothetical protein EDC94DRAFT_612188 [Helicostylum pulchrum]